MTEKVKCKRCGKPMKFYEENTDTIDFICNDCNCLFRINKKYIDEVVANQ